MPDGVVIGAGPNGLVAANLLADAGWEVLVLEAEDEPGGAVRSGELAPGYVYDRCSSFYPLPAASPVMRSLRLEDHDLRWRRHPYPLAHPSADGRAAVVAPDLDRSAASVDAFHAGDGEAWQALMELWRRAGPALLRALVTPFPPLRPAVRLATALGPRRSLDFVRFGLTPARRFANQHFGGDGAARLLAGNALHADLGPEQAGSALYGWVLCGLAQAVGFPVAEGGAGSLTRALVRRLQTRGGRVVCGARATRIEVRRGRAVAVRTADGTAVGARRAVLADVSAPALFVDLLPSEAVPARVLAAVRRFSWGPATFKADWALSGPVPWTAEAARRAGTVHVAEDTDALTRHAVDLALGRLPERPFVVAGQYARADPSRMPPGHEVLYAYSHVPQGRRWDRSAVTRFADCLEEQVEAMAPGFRDLVVARKLHPPPQLEASDANLVGGALNGGTAQLHQQLILRPVPGLGRPETPVAGLYLASASAHPGGGVHGGCGAIAARAALREPGPLRRLAARAAAAAVPDPLLDVPDG